jgi:hypothetical protein
MSFYLLVVEAVVVLVVLLELVETLDAITE